MRIISGNFKGLKLNIPLNKKTRPLKDITKESIFNTLSHSNKFLFYIKNSIILDLFSGTGSFGLECLSRNAKKVTFVENDKDALKILFKNVHKIKLMEKTKIIENSVLNYLSNLEKSNYKFDLIFVDPPYKAKNISELIEDIYYKKILKKKGIVIIHRNKNFDENYPDYFKILDTREYGVSKIIFGSLIS